MKRTKFDTFIEIMDAILLAFIIYLLSRLHVY